MTTTRKDVWASLQELCNKAGEDAPRPGRKVRLVRGRYKGRSGKVTWHGRDRFDDSLRYCNAFQAAVREARGREGFRIRVELPEGGCIFTRAEYAELV